MSAMTPGLRWFLLGSLALNVTLGAALALPYVAPGFYGRQAGQEHRTRGWRDPVPSIWRVRRLLGEERSELVKSVMQAHRPRIRETFPAMRAARAEVRRQMQAEPIDGEALRRAFAELRARDAATSAAVQEMLADLMQQLTPAERTRIVESMPEPRGRGRGRRERGREDRAND